MDGNTHTKERERAPHFTVFLAAHRAQHSTPWPCTCTYPTNPADHDPARDSLLHSAGRMGWPRLPPDPISATNFWQRGTPFHFFFFSHRTAWYGWKFNTRTRTQANAHIHRRKRIQTYLRTCVRSCIQLYVSLKAWKYETHIHMQPLSALPSSIQ